MRKHPIQKNPVQAWVTKMLQEGHSKEAIQAAIRERLQAVIQKHASNP